MGGYGSRPFAKSPYYPKKSLLGKGTVPILDLTTSTHSTELRVKTVLILSNHKSRGRNNDY